MTCTRTMLKLFWNSACGKLTFRSTYVSASVRHMCSTTMAKYLVAFDFDHTIVDENSDLYIRKLAPNGKIPEAISKLYNNKGWTEYMGAIFEYLHENNTTREDINKCLKEIKFVAGMTELFDYLSSDAFDSIIISDANSIFIEHILSSANMKSAFAEIHTNPAHFDENGCLRVKYYHTQDWCDLSTVNLCKGHILDEYIKKQAVKGVHYDLVAYVGDGNNDYCPSLRLKRPSDIVLPRVGFSLMKALEKPEKREKISCAVVPWSSGTEILSALKEGISNLD